MWRRNLAVLAGIIGAFLVLASVLDARPDLVRDAAWQRWALSALLAGGGGFGFVQSTYRVVRSRT